MKGFPLFAYVKALIRASVIGLFRSDPNGGGGGREQKPGSSIIPSSTTIFEYGPVAAEDTQS